jgi:hypothetical protein
MLKICEVDSLSKLGSSQLNPHLTFSVSGVASNPEKSSDVCRLSSSTSKLSLPYRRTVNGSSWIGSRIPSAMTSVMMFGSSIGSAFWLACGAFLVFDVQPPILKWTRSLEKRYSSSSLHKKLPVILLPHSDGRLGQVDQLSGRVVCPH